LNTVSAPVFATITVSGPGGTRGFESDGAQFLIFLLVAFAVAFLSTAIFGALCELGCWVNRHRGPLPRARDGRLLYTVRFEGGPAGMASLRIMSDSQPLLSSLKADCPKPFRILLAAGAIGEATLQSEDILGAIEHTLTILGSPASAPALYTQLRTVRDLMRRHPFARFQRIIDTPHPVAAGIPTAHLAEPQRCQGFAVIICH